MRALILCIVDEEYLCNFLIKEDSDLYKIFNNFQSILCKKYQYDNIIQIGKDDIELEILLKDIRNYANLVCNDYDQLNLIFSNNDESSYFHYYCLIKQLSRLEFGSNDINTKDYNISEFQLVYII